MESKPPSLGMAASNGEVGRRLVFLVSQPRAGSTMLQMILRAHPAIHTTDEPWLMLHPLYAIRNRGLSAEYDADLCHSAFQRFLATLPAGEQSFYEAVGKYAGLLYTQALESTGSSLFLDKTPRYYLLLRELQRVFPDAATILLVRNPLAVLCSLVRTYVGRNWSLLGQFHHDLLTAPRCLLERLQRPGPRDVVVHYESLLRDTEGEVQKICAHLGIAFDPGMIHYGRVPRPNWTFGDPDLVRRVDAPVRDHADAWTESLRDPPMAELVSDYLQRLGRETLTSLGYDFDRLWETVHRFQRRTRSLFFRRAPRRLFATHIDRPPAVSGSPAAGDTATETEPRVAEAA